MAGWWLGCPRGGRLGGSAAISAACVLLGLFIFFHPCPSHVLRQQREPGSPFAAGRGAVGAPYPSWPLLGREMPLEDGDPASWRGQQANGEVSGTPQLRGTGDPPPWGTPAPDGSRTEAMAEGWEPGPAPGDRDVTFGGAPQRAGQEPWQREEALMGELSELVQKVVKSSSWWERHGVDISILTCSFLLLPAGNPAQPPPAVTGGPRGGLASSSRLLHRSCNFVCTGSLLAAY